MRQKGQASFFPLHWISVKPTDAVSKQKLLGTRRWLTAAKIDSVKKRGKPRAEPGSGQPSGAAGER